MECIYCWTNTENGKRYIGQTNDFNQRVRAHKSSAFNPKSSEYNSAFHCALRKYGLNKFKVEILEEFPDGVSQEEKDEREIFFIAHYQSLVSQHGYNATEGGQFGIKIPLTYEEKIKKSSIFSAEEIQDIQQMLMDGRSFKEILEKYSPKLKDSFLSNINTGLNFKNDAWEYPLKKEHFRGRSLTKEDVVNIQQALMNGETQKTLVSKYDISPSLISMINSGHTYFNEDLIYPLQKNKHGSTMATLARKLLITTNLNYDEIAQEVGYNQTDSISNINNGRTRRDSRLKYPLRKYQKENKEILALM